MRTEPKNLAWLDLETTGLRRPNIIEVGLIITTPSLEILKEERWLTPFFGSNEWEEWEGEAIAMHAKSGLLEEMRTKRTHGSGDAEEFIVSFLATMIQFDALGSPMCGNSVHFDRSTMRMHAPVVVDFFGYRNLDVSSFKEVWTRILKKPSYEESLGSPTPKHRALDDLSFSIASLDYYLTALREAGVSPSLGG